VVGMLVGERGVFFWGRRVVGLFFCGGVGGRECVSFVFFLFGFGLVFGSGAGLLCWSGFGCFRCVFWFWWRREGSF